MQVGYLPDMFGHVAQMPQILRLRASSTRWCGGRARRDRRRPRSGGRRPTAPRVRAEYLYGSYWQRRATSPTTPRRSSRRVERLRAELGRGRASAATMLLMNGTDHQMPQPWLGRVVAEANEMQDDYALRRSRRCPSTSPSSRTRRAASTWHGELRSGARANLLMGVASNRVDVHQAAARAERGLERLAEPLTALLLAAGRMARRAPRRGVARGRAQQRARLDLRVLARRGGAGGPPPLRRGRSHRRRAGGSCPRRRVPHWLATRLRRGGRVAAVVVNPSQRTRTGLVELERPRGRGSRGRAGALRRCRRRLPMLTRTSRRGRRVARGRERPDRRRPRRADQRGPEDGTVDLDLLVDPRRFGLLDPSRGVRAAAGRSPTIDPTPRSGSGTRAPRRPARCWRLPRTCPASAGRAGSRTLPKAEPGDRRRRRAWHVQRSRHGAGGRRRHLLAERRCRARPARSTTATGATPTTSAQWATAPRSRG